MPIDRDRADAATRRALDQVLELPGTARLVDGIIETLPPSTVRTLSQRALDTEFTAWLYDRGRDRLLRLAGQPDFATEAGHIEAQLRPEAGDVVLDLACGHGNFTVEWARRVGPGGLVIGVDYSKSMLARAVARVRDGGLDNVVLIHADAHDLPLRPRSFDCLNCSGGFHAFPDLPKALRELARVARPGARLTASTFAATGDDAFRTPKRWAGNLFGLNFVAIDALGGDLSAAGFTDYEWTRPRAAFGYLSATRDTDA
ncbi:methyltransferase domain-containing protein [Nocardia nova SH22a]|uniref:Methyltransferase domain-containing protein n=1 Tax=Nocardia nova SH22a TaxID=1415166 RepID=W5TP78_9NOCA|nr:methyltransferase domain-containing protein [Nocardia nova]AHH19046.1 methyltransferase domain-containing protein [Nocardia nova SH22a]